MRHTRGLAALLALSLLWTGGALADTEQLSGTIVAGYEVGVIAPFGGKVSAVQMRAGQWIDEGDLLVTVEPTRYYAPIDGTVASVEAELGDALGGATSSGSASSTGSASVATGSVSAATGSASIAAGSASGSAAASGTAASTGTTASGGAVLSIAPISKYTIACSVSDVYGTDVPARKYVSIGENIYIRCTKDRSHVALGKITAVSDADYTVETTGGELYLEEEVNIYRSGSYAFDTWIGTGTVARTETVEMSGSGSLLRLCVKEGDEVERGQLLFETVTGSLEGYAATDNGIYATASGVLSAVSLSVGDTLAKGAVVAALSPKDGFQLAVTVPEDMINRIHEGDRLRFFLDWDDDEQRWYEGTVESLSYISTVTTGDTTTFTAYLDFDADESVRLGMNAVVELESDGEAASGTGAEGEAAPGEEALPQGEAPGAKETAVKEGNRQ